MNIIIIVENMLSCKVNFFLKRLTKHFEINCRIDSFDEYNLKLIFDDFTLEFITNGKFSRKNDVLCLLNKFNIEQCIFSVRGLNENIPPPTDKMIHRIGDKFEGLKMFKVILRFSQSNFFPNFFSFFWIF